MVVNRPGRVVEGVSRIGGPTDGSEATKPYRFGVRLRYDLMTGIGPYATRKAAEAAEKTVAEALERRGHRVFWG